jgi:hypothetical protein
MRIPGAARRSPASRYRRVAVPAGPRGALICWTVMKSASLTSAGCAGRREMTHPSGRFHRCTCRCPRLVLAGSIRCFLCGGSSQARAVPG